MLPCQIQRKKKAFQFNLGNCKMENFASKRIETDLMEVN